MNEELLKKVEANSRRIEEIFISVEKTRKYIMWTAIITVLLFVLPLIGLAFAIPKYIETLTSISNF